MQRRLAAILAADMVGYSRLIERDEAGTIERLKTDRQALIDPSIAAHGGHIVRMAGDGALVEFPSVVEAVQCALDIQRCMPERNEGRSEDQQIVFRMGVNTGDIVVENDNLHGEGINVAARLESLCEPGAILLSEEAARYVEGKIDAGLEFVEERTVKNIDRPVRIWRIDPSAAPPDKAIAPFVRSRKRHWRYIVPLAGILGAAIVGLLWYQPWAPRVEAARVERMAFPLPDKPSIAVLPFENLSDDPQQEYLSDGLTNDIITDLSKFKDLFVIASNSTFSYKDKPVRVQQVAEELGVRYVLEGSLQRMSQRLRINAQLIDATTGHHLWAERYDRDASDFFAIQENILQTIVASLASQVDEAEIKRALGKNTENVSAYDYYQQGRKALRRYTKEANNEALELIEKAIEIDPSYARAFSLLTWIHANNSSGRYSWGENPERSLDLVLKVAHKAVELAPEDYYTYWALGYAHIFQGDFDRAEAAYERAIAINPNDALLLANMVELLIKLGRTEQAIAQMKLAMRINPRHPDWYYWDLGLAQYFAGRYDDALASLNKMSNPPNGVRRTLAAVLVRLGRIEEARDVITKFIETDVDMTLEEMEAFAWKDRKGLARWIADLRVAGLPENRSLLPPEEVSKTNVIQ